MIDVREATKLISSEIINWRRELHQFPEIGLELPQTAKYVSDQLTKMQVKHETGIAKSGIVGLIEGAMPGKKRTIGIRADMDGLPIQEKTGLPYQSKNKNMHACGHDGHTAMLLGAAKILNANKDLFSGNVKLIFQPAEEGPGGAKPMIEEGVLDNPKVDCMMGLHLNAVIPELKSGGIAICEGPVMPSADIFTIKIKGRAGHGGAPHLTVDPIVISAQVITALQTIISRELKPMNAAVISIGKISGGTVFNAIPDEVIMKGTVRAIEKEDQKRIQQRIKEIVEGVTRTMQGDYELQYDFGYPALINEKKITDHVTRSAAKIIGDEMIHVIKKQ